MSFTSKKLVRVILLLLTAHVAISLVYIFFPSVPTSNGLAKAYKRYLLPGPFFTESRIEKSQLLFLSWKINNHWSQPINPTYEHYANFYNHINPSFLYRSSLERDIYERGLMKLDSGWLKGQMPREIEFMKEYFVNKHKPVNADSTKMIFIRSITRSFESKADTVKIIVF